MGRVSKPIAVIGPTATGKSDLALDVAERVGGQIVNIDAQQMYRGMDVGTAKLPVSERRGITHHMIDVLDVTDVATVANYQHDAGQIVDDLLSRSIVPVIVGGSMMYIQSLLDHWTFPATDPVVRAKWEALLEAEGLGAVHQALRSVDPVAADTILPTDGRRMVRALEVVEITGRPFAASQPTRGDSRWGTTIIGLDRETDELDDRILRRTALMFEQGLVEEVEKLIPLGLREGQTARRAIGYAQVLAALDGEYPMAEAQEITAQGTRRYVRRQRSWFRRDTRVTWLNPADSDVVGRAVQVAGIAG
ncbi:tRNA (adenosine(37)-N6)-dimethylallyltransferase MiaA [Smaragdicoccus niigatensis]|uniref:tRNA (adenosine(37)-N6)-dimethylallyltransferase MiaA n=1 Tax=Smaragdicoccus niigatensis TaxID=359359 RepID=UPI00036EA1E4